MYDFVVFVRKFVVILLEGTLATVTIELCKRQGAKLSKCIYYVKHIKGDRTVHLSN